MKVAFAGAFAAQMAEPVRARLALPCEVVVDDEAGIVPRLTRDRISGGNQVVSIAPMPLSITCCRKNDCLRPVTSASSRNPC